MPVLLKSGTFKEVLIRSDINHESTIVTWNIILNGCRKGIRKTLHWFPYTKMPFIYILQVSEGCTHVSRSGFSSAALAPNESSRLKNKLY